MIYRTVKNKDNVYFMLNRTAINDSRLSLKAVGIHTYIMSKPDNWVANETDITNSHADGKASVRAGVAELIDYGYMARVQMRKSKAIVGWRIDTYESPLLNPHFVEGQEPAHIVENLDGESELDSEKLDVDNRNVGLDSDFLDVEKQDVGNRNHKDTKIHNDDLKRESPPLFLPSAADRNGWNRKPKQFIDGIASQVEPFGITMAAFRVLVDHILAKHGKLEIANVDTAHGNTALSQAQECALNLLAVDKDTFGTVDGIDTIYQSWKSNDYRGATLPTLGQLVDHAGLMKANQVRKAALTTAKTEQDFSVSFFQSAAGG